MNYLNFDKNKLEPVIDELNILLSDYHLYYQNLRAFHWNILGKNFFDLHIKFEALYVDARLKIDDIAERILSLRFHPFSKYSQYLEKSNITEVNPLVDDSKMISVLLDNHKSILQQMYKVINAADAAGDEGTIDLIGAYIRELEKESWMLNAWEHKTSDTLNLAKEPASKN